MAAVDFTLGAERPTITRGEPNEYTDLVRKLSENRDETAETLVELTGETVKIGKDREEDRAVATLRRKLDEAGNIIGVTVRKSFQYGMKGKQEVAKVSIWAVDKQRRGSASEE